MSEEMSDPGAKSIVTGNSLISISTVVSIGAAFVAGVFWLGSLGQQVQSSEKRLVLLETTQIQQSAKLTEAVQTLKHIRELLAEMRYRRSSPQAPPTKTDPED